MKQPRTDRPNYVIIDDMFEEKVTKAQIKALEDFLIKHPDNPNNYEIIKRKEALIKRLNSI